MMLILNFLFYNNYHNIVYERCGTLWRMTRPVPRWHFAPVYSAYKDMRHMINHLLKKFIITFANYISHLSDEILKKN